MYRIVFLVIFSSVLLSCGKQIETRLPYFNSPDFEAYFISDKSEINREITHRIADFSLQDQNGETITDSLISGKIHVANCPNIRG